MRFAPGESVSIYEIIGPLGAGAMGEVYRARDTRLQRDVALKVLPDALSEDEERLHRFEREAQSLATLSHPNVAQIYGIDEVGELRFMAMEYVPGEDLAARLKRGPLDFGEAIDACRQIAAGVEAAHESGIIHRDLKPANVVLTPDGRAKVLDFGLAKAFGAGGEDSASSDPLLTEAGRLVGTPMYMAPEQARGKPADKRADVWAFGCVLYECLTGARAFGGDSLGDVFTSVLERDPDLSLLPRATPEPVRTLIARCLDRDVRTRLRDIGEARIVLERRSFADGNEGATPSRPARRRPLAFAGAALAVLSAGVLLGSAFRGRSDPVAVPALRPQRLTEMAGMEEMPAVSPDGNNLVFVARVDGKRQLFLRPIARAVAEQITKDPIDHEHPRWADDNTLLFVARGKVDGDASVLREVVVPGSSAPRTIMTVQGEVDVGRRSRRLATFRREGSGTLLVIAPYRQPRDETVHALPAGIYSAPRWSPDESTIAFEHRVGLNKTEIRVFDPETAATTTVKRIVGQTMGVAWSPDGSGFVYSSSEGSTLPYPPTYSLRRINRDGTGDVVLCEGAGYASYVSPDVTGNGSLVATRIAIESDIYRYPVDGTPVENVRNAKRITHQTGIVQVPSASPDGEEVAFLSDSGGRANVWIVRVDGSTPPRPITNEENPRAIIGIPVWSPSGEWITYWRSSGESGSDAEQWIVRPDGTDPHLLVRSRGAAVWSHDGEWLYHMGLSDDPDHVSTYRIRVTGGEPEFVRDRCGGLMVTSDGKTCYFAGSDTAEGVLLRASPVESGEAEVVVDVEARLPLWPHMFALSADDRSFATPLRDAGTTNLWRVVAADGSLEQITDFGHRATLIGRQVSWSRDGKYIFAALMEMDADIVLFTPGGR